MRKLTYNSIFLTSKEKKKVNLFSNIFMNIQLSTIVEKQKQNSNNKTPTYYIPKDRTRAGFLE